MENVWNKRPTVPAERKMQVLRYVEENGSAVIRELSSAFGVSEATVRRDLMELAAEGCVERTHGGAILPGGHTASHTRTARLSNQMDEKRAIASCAATYIQDGDTVFLDAGTTTYLVAQALLSHRDLTIITYDLTIASTIPFSRSCTVIVTGGTRREGENMLTGPLAENFLRSVRVEKAILSADAVDMEYGVSSCNFVEANLKRMIVEASHWVALVADHTKFSKTALARICPLTGVDLIISDRGLDSSFARKLKQANCSFFLA